MKRWKSAIFIVVLILGLLTQYRPAIAAHAYRALLISAYHPAFPTFFQQIEGVQAGFAGKNIELDVEFMDSKRFFNETNLSQFHDLLAYKLSQVEPYDVIIVSDDNALHFALEFQEELFPEIPIVFLGINNVELAVAQNEAPLVTGVVEAVSMKDTIALTTQLNPNLARLYVIVDSTPSGQGDLETFYEKIVAFPEIQYEILSLADMTFADLSTKLETLTAQDAVLLLSAYRDSADNALDFDESLALILSDLDAPLYHLYYHGMGDGVLGGKLISHLEQGKTAAGLAWRILEGTPVDQIAVVTDSPNEYIFDYVVLQKFNIDKSLLPDDAQLINEPTTIYYQYRGVFWGVTAVFAILSLLLIRLFVINRLQQRTEQKLRTRETELRENQVHLKTAVQELQDMQKVLVRQERLAAVGQLSAGIAHDFNNILASILLYTQLLQRQLAASPQVSSRLELIVEQCDRAADLVQQVLDFSGRSMLHRAPVEVGSFLQGLCQLLKRTLPENIQVSLQKEDPNCYIDADPTRLQQIILNLALNARDAMPDGGHLHIQIEKIIDQAPTQCPVCGEFYGGDLVKIDVADSGHGIPQEIIAKIFEPFFTTKAPTGSGLGLAQVYGIVKQHNGHLSVDTQKGQGTTFSLLFPAIAPPLLTQSKAPQNTVQYGNKELILVVEDNETVQEVLIANLDYLGYRTITAVNGQEALDIFEATDEEIALVISDQIMPVMGGAALFKALRQKSKSVPFIMLSGHPLNNGLPKDDYLNHFISLSKPLKLEALATAVSRLLPTKRAQQTAVPPLTQWPD
ncbi:MAG: response regulator [Anaerolineales bacterium]|nr:response regulator [Anaerolineales bacterium]